jgi:hypothetical protein
MEAFFYTSDRTVGWQGLFGTSEDFMGANLQINESDAGDGTWHCWGSAGSGWPDDSGQVTTNKMADQSWQHVAMMRTGSTITFWHNGVVCYSSGGWDDADIGGNDELYIGKSQLDVRGWKGAINNVRISTTGRYTHNTVFTPPAAPFTTDGSTWLLIQGSSESEGSTAIADSSGNNRTINQHNPSYPVTWTQVAPLIGPF